MVGAQLGAKGLTSGFSFPPGGGLAEEFEVLISPDFEVIGKLFGGEVAGEDFFEGVALPP